MSVVFVLFQRGRVRVLEKTCITEYVPRLNTTPCTSPAMPEDGVSCTAGCCTKKIASPEKYFSSRTICGHTTVIFVLASRRRSHTITVLDRPTSQTCGCALDIATEHILHWGSKEETFTGRRKLHGFASKSSIFPAKHADLSTTLHLYSDIFRPPPP